jgi:hypothetical protein
LWLPKNAWNHNSMKMCPLQKFHWKKDNQGMLLQLISITWKALNYLYHSHHRAILWPLLHTLKCSLETKTCTTLEESIP